MAGWRTKKRINIIIVIMWAISFGITVYIHPTTYGNYVFNNTEINTEDWVQFMEGYPTVSYRAMVTASTGGIFSNANPVHLEIHILNANVTDLTNYYPTVNFIDLEKSTQGSEFRLMPSPKGGWTASGDISFFQAERVWMFLAPETPPNMSLNIFAEEVAFIISQKEVLRLESASEAVAFQFNSFAVKIAFIFGTFSIFLLAPILENIFVPEDDKKQSASQQDKTEDDGIESNKDTKEKHHDSRPK